MPHGDTCKLDMGKNLNGPAILPRFISFWNEKSVGPVTVWKSIRRMDMAIRIPQEKLEVLKADLIFYSKQILVHYKIMY
jgi:hypothetical protein